jgi:type II secretory pathway component GspD/PulD (secretin)
MHRVLTTAVLFLAFTATTNAQESSDTQPVNSQQAEAVGRIEVQVAALAARIDDLAKRLESLDSTDSQTGSVSGDPTDYRYRLSLGTKVREGTFRFASQPDGVEIKVFTLANADARSIVKLVSKLLPSIESREVRIAADKRTNSVVAYGPHEELQFIGSLIVVLDGSIESNDAKAD